MLPAFLSLPSLLPHLHPMHCAHTAFLLATISWLPVASVFAEDLAFERDIRPIFREHCYDCHGATQEMEGGLDLRLVRFMQRGGDSGPAIVPGRDHGQSLLLTRIRTGEMPPGESRVSAEDIRTIERWLASGAKTARPEPETIGPGLGITEEERAFWSFQPIRSTQVPSTASEDAHAIDAFIVASLPEGETLSGEASRATLVKRAYFDLLGLPPTIADIQRWTAIAEDHWYDMMLEELLASPQYGERWARHWLDVAGYADSEGYTTADANRDWSWRYRDWVVQAFNADKPFDRFVLEQLAGDELAGPKSGDWTDEQISLLTATGFLRMAADGTGSGANNEEGRNQVVADTLRIVSTSLLGLSMHCAQCHDHRYDPIPQTDYYRLRAVFEPALDPKAWKTPAGRRVSLYTEADRQRAAEVEAETAGLVKTRAERLAKYMADALAKELTKYEDPLKSELEQAYKTPAAKRTAEQQALFKKYPSINITPGNLYQYIAESRPELKKLDDEIAKVRSRKPAEEFVRALVEPPRHQPVTHLFHRGDPRQPQQPVAPGSLSVTTESGSSYEFPAAADGQATTGRRTAYAKWLTNGQHPLLARVLVNRVWMHHFGQGLVSTPSDFGKLGGRPTHPQLLDHLAAEFMGNGWSLKELHRSIMRSQAYRQEGETIRAVGPAKRYQAKPLLRLDAETLRDRMLATTGSLETRMGGRPVEIKTDDVGQVVVAEQNRRSLYVKVRRSQPVAMLQAFDAPVMETNCERRAVSTVATQSLMLMNSAFVLQQAKLLAERARREAQPLESSRTSSLPTLARAPNSAWQYGHGQWLAEEQRVQFLPLAHWGDGQWRGGPTLPDPVIGWTLWHAAGGHPGAAAHAAIRRWTAPVDGVAQIRGELSHGSEHGDGVHGRIIAAGDTQKAVWEVANGKTATNLDGVRVNRGDTIDFIIESGETVTSDSFSWGVKIQLASDAGDLAFDSQQQFSGPMEDLQKTMPEQIVSAWKLALCREPEADELRLAMAFIHQQLKHLFAHPEQRPEGITAGQQALTNLCQSLLTCNEFLYVD